ncbi:nucleoside hydrolase [Anaerobaca lacustris]|uniref:Nucleoside hydrolase n=1 Tax=Anaerobaca lacustris TaxID=3044600 RepID=A0AAW6U2F5_9BACT|nr:nucleoside hydrolase [Sedimentisphaerales bacterium M17dextr]
MMSTPVQALYLATLCLIVVGAASCSHSSSRRIRVIFDTDANNEVDDQHAMAYLLFSGDTFDVAGVTVNATSDPNGFRTPSNVQDHYDEARRVMQLCGQLYGRIPLKLGAQGGFEEIAPHLDRPDFDGHEAVDFIIEQAGMQRDGELILLAVGKLTNVALAVAKEPSIARSVRLYWLGANYPGKGEHNKVWDIPAMNFLLDSDIPFEVVTVRYGDPSGTDAVKVTKAQILHRMPGKGPRISEPITGRHGGRFDNWGDYSANLFEMYQMYGNPPSRSLFDMAAVAVVKNPDWAERRMIPTPIYDIENDKWIDRPDNPRQIALWEWFDIYGIMNDFFVTMRQPVLVEPCR